MQQRTSIVFLPVVVLFVLFVGTNCRNHNNEAEDQNLQEKAITIVDSIPLFKGSSVYENFEIDFTLNKALLFGPYSGIHELDLISEKVTKVADIGNSRGDINISLFTAKYLPDGSIIIAELLTNGKFYLFDPKRNLVFEKKHVDIFPARGEMAPFICSNIDVLHHNKDSTMIGLGLNILPTNLSGWEKEDCYAKLVIKNNHLEFISSHFPLEMNSIVSNAVARKIEYSPFVVPRISSDKDKVYLKFIFDNHIYRTDRQFNTIEKLQFTPFYDSYEFFIEIGKPSGRQASIKQNFSNFSIESFAIYNNKAFMIYPKPIPPEYAPKTIEEVREQLDRKRLLQILDLSTGQEAYVKLPARLDGHNLQVQDESTFFFLGNKHFQEDNYIYKAVMQ